MFSKGNKVLILESKVPGTNFLVRKLYKDNVGTVSHVDSKGKVAVITNGNKDFWWFNPESLKEIQTLKGIQK